MLVLFKGIADLEKEMEKVSKCERGCRVQGCVRMSRENRSNCEVEIQTSLTVYSSVSSYYLGQ